MLHVDEVTFGYATGAPIIDHWSASFRTGTMTAIVGASGRGKSTSLYLLGLMLKPQSGQITVDSIPVSSQRDPDRSALRARLFGFVFQDAALDATRTVLDNVIETSLYSGMPRSAAVQRGEELLDRFEVRARSKARPGEVSGGQAQRIALCRALLNRPRFVLADEPTGNLDDTTARLVLTALSDEAARDAAVIIVTHDTRVANTCHHVIEL